MEHSKIDVLIISAPVSRSRCSAAAFEYFTADCILGSDNYRESSSSLIYPASGTRRERERKKIPAMNHNLATPAEANPAIFRPGPFCPSYYWTAQVGESSRRPPIRFITCPSACLFFYFYPCGRLLGLWRQEKGHYSTRGPLARTVRL